VALERGVLGGCRRTDGPPFTLDVCRRADDHGQGDGCVRPILIMPTVAVALVLPSPPPSTAFPVIQAALGSAAIIEAEDLADRLGQGTSVDMAGVTVAGDLDLRDVGNVRSPFRCVGCIFTGSIVIRDVIFERALDLSGSTIGGSMDAVGSALRGGFSFRGSEESPALIEGPADFSRSTFGDPTSFDGATFASASNFTGASFLGRTSFADALFTGDTSFDEVIFGGDAVFSSLALGAPTTGLPLPCVLPVRGGFAGEASFNRTAFAGTVDFRQLCFVQDATFTITTFGKRVDFTLATFHADTSFEGASFEGDGAFLLSNFEGTVSFQRAAAARSLLFEDAVFLDHVRFFSLAVSGTLSLRDAEFRGTVDLREGVVGDLAMDLPDIAAIAGRAREWEEVLERIEDSAEARGDIAIANDARFQLLALQNTQLGWFPRTMDWFFYRLIAGYLVRPLNPLLAFVGLLFIGAFVRTIVWARRRRRSESDDPDNPAEASRLSLAQRGHARVLGLAQLTSAFFQRLGDTVRVAFTKKPDVTLEDTEHIRPYLVAGVQWGESIAFKVVIALFILALASSNSTLKQVIDSVRG